MGQDPGCWAKGYLVRLPDTSRSYGTGGTVLCCALHKVCPTDLNEAIDSHCQAGFFSLHVAHPTSFQLCRLHPCSRVCMPEALPSTPALSGSRHKAPVVQPSASTAVSNVFQSNDRHRGWAHSPMYAGNNASVLGPQGLCRPRV